MQYHLTLKKFKAAWGGKDSRPIKPGMIKYVAVKNVIPELLEIETIFQANINGWQGDSKDDSQLLYDF